MKQQKMLIMKITVLGQHFGQIKNIERILQKKVGLHGNVLTRPISFILEDLISGMTAHSQTIIGHLSMKFVMLVREFLRERKSGFSIYYKKKNKNMAQIQIEIK